MRSQRLTLFALTAVAVGVLAAPPAARAGCGCDHPLPAASAVMPAFGSPGKLVYVAAAGGASFTVGATYEVDFGSGAAVDVVAHAADAIRVNVPQDAPVGPVALRVQGPGYDHEYPDHLFTALPKATVLDERNGALKVQDLPVAVSADGTLLLPIDLTNVRAATQLALTTVDFPLSFEPDDVAFFNADGVDLRLFTLTVDDPTERQWGSYFGWDVEQDNGIIGQVFRSKVMSRWTLDVTGDVLTYWRHEFDTYADAHAAGGTHAVDAAGYHPDGTRHVDHYNIVVAISGGERQGSGDPLPLEPGSHEIDALAVSMLVDAPMEPDMVAAIAYGYAAFAQVTSYHDMPYGEVEDPDDD